MVKFKVYKGRILKKGIRKNMFSVLAERNSTLYNEICKNFHIVSSPQIGWYKNSYNKIASFSYYVIDFAVLYNISSVVITGASVVIAIPNLPKEIKDKIKNIISIELFETSNFNIKISEMA